LLPLKQPTNNIFDHTEHKFLQKTYSFDPETEKVEFSNGQPVTIWIPSFKHFAYSNLKCKMKSRCLVNEAPELCSLLKLALFTNKNWDPYVQMISDGKYWGGFYKAIYALRLKFALCAHLFPLI
jgi:hypothetical protein